MAQSASMLDQDKTNEKQLESKLDADHKSSKHQHYISTKMRRNRSAKKRENHSTRQDWGSGLNDSSWIYAHVQGLSKIIQNMYHIEHLYKTVGGKNKQNLQVSIPKTSGILLARVCVPAFKLDAAWVGKEVQSMNFHGSSGCNIIMWRNLSNKTTAPNYHLPTRCSIKAKGREGNGAMLQHKPCISTFFGSKKGTIQ